MDKEAIVHHKIMDITTLKRTVAIWKFKDDEVVFTNGCFDIFHKGHAHLLNTAAGFGNRLIVGLNSDSSVQKIKKPGRPLQHQDARAYVLASMHLVDAVILFDDETPAELIAMLQPHILVKGGDYSPATIAGADTVLASGGRVEIVPLLPGYSTTAIEQKIIADYTAS